MLLVGCMPEGTRQRMCISKWWME